MQNSGQKAGNQTDSPAVSSRYSNTGRLNQTKDAKTPHYNPPEGERGFGVGLDWIRLTIPPGVDIDPRPTLGRVLTNTKGKAPGPSYGYKFAQEALKTGRLMQSESLGWCLDLPGSALSYAEVTNGWNVYDLLTDIMQTSPLWRCTRLDVAMDVFRPAVSMGLVLDHIRRDDIACTARKKKSIHEHDHEGESVQTLYIGNRESERFGRAYDKQAEMYQVYGERMPHCTRFELEMKGSLSRAAAQQLITSADPRRDSIGMIRRFMEFLDPKDRHKRDKNTRRRARWWLDLVDGNDPIRFGLANTPSEPAKTTRWLLKALSRTLYLVKQSGLQVQIEAAIERLQRGNVTADELHHWEDFRQWVIHEMHEAGPEVGTWRDPTGRAEAQPAREPAGLERVLGVDRKADLS